jgi:hypothetical protein
MKWLDLGNFYEFEDRSGIIRKTAGCSIVGHFAFCDRLNQLWEILGEADGDQTWVEIYGDSPRFRHIVAELLRLNGLDPEWFTLGQIAALLFGVGDQPGYLVQINTLRPSDKPAEVAKTLAEVVAGLADNLAEALELAANVPAQAMADISAARAELYATPEERQERERAANIDKLRQNPNFRELING